MILFLAMMYEFYYARTNSSRALMPLQFQITTPTNSETCLPLSFQDRNALIQNISLKHFIHVAFMATAHLPIIASSLEYNTDSK